MSNHIVKRNKIKRPSAALLAAAPGMLTILKQLRRDPMTRMREGRFWARFDALIEKAEGR